MFRTVKVDGKIQVGKSYQSRDGKIFTITAPINPNEKPFEQGYRYWGCTTRNPDKAFEAIYTVAFNEMGLHALSGTTPCDLVSEVIPRINLIDITVGQFVGIPDETTGTIGDGTAEGWVIEDHFHISQEVANAIQCQLGIGDKDFDQLLTCDSARCMSHIGDDHGYITSMLVVYYLEGWHYLSRIVEPEGKYVS